MVLPGHPQRVSGDEFVVHRVEHWRFVVEGADVKGLHTQTLIEPFEAECIESRGPTLPREGLARRVEVFERDPAGAHVHHHTRQSCPFSCAWRC